ncbi:MAG: glucose-6-phosphate 1-dehydrogenase [Solirubrobacteraceae bacterium]|jgi:glucose-6-phosphate 1-dehydrogenase|nr:glucose-6-phosphate 1-dehydrogenase [Solirubrobacteraceae bacterium]
MTTPQRPTNRVLVLFGATGDLAARKLFPGFFHLYREKMMPEDFRIIGSGRHSPGSDDEFRDTIHAALERHGRLELDERWDEFAAKLSFVVSSADDGQDLASAVSKAEEEIGAEGQRLVYLSVPPTATKDMAQMLGATGIADNCALVVEKPFGHDLASARELNAALHEVLDEEDIYRIDHFLGKEAAQNILVARFANGMLEPIWNRDHVAYVQVDVPEEIDIQGRSGFYEQTGAFRDMVVTHLLQILGIVALEPPSRIDAESLHMERTKLFDALRPIDPDRVVFGQYKGYRDEDDVADDSQVETFVALEVRVDTWRWSGVPFYLRTGKALAEGRRTVTIGFTEAPLRLFPHHASQDKPRPSELVFELSDDPTVRIEVQAKIPGPVIDLGRAALTLDVQQAFDGADGLEAYERLLHDVMLGERLLFTRSEQIERLWEVVAPVLEDPPEPQPYSPGSWGPEAALKLCGDPGWRLPDSD